MSVLDFLDEQLADLTARDRLRIPRVVSGAQGARIRLDGREVVSFSSNDYLGLAGDPRLRAAAIAEIHRSGVGAGASRLIVGNQEAHVELEAALARLFRCESALLFNSGYAANTGLLSVLADGADAIFSDELNHASIIDGCRLSRAKVEVYRHADHQHLIDLLARSTARRKIIVTESVFSMDGDLADLVGLRGIADRHGAILVVDEAHAMGALGPTGGGLLEALGVSADIVVGTLGKSLGAGGACVAGSKALTRILWNRARSLVFSTGMPAMVAASARAAVEIVQSREGSELRARVQRSSQRVLAGVPRGTGDVVPRGTRGSVPRGTAVAPCVSPIVPLIVGSDREVMRWTDRLLEQGIFVQGIRPPTVPEGTARLRIAISAAHSDAEVDRLLDALRGSKAAEDAR